MKLGFALPHIGPIANRSNIHKAAQEAEALGYDGLTVSEVNRGGRSFRWRATKR